MNSFLLLCDVFLFVFWKKLKTPKMHFEINWPLAGSSKMAPRILIFSMTMGADYSFELISIETYAPQFIGHNKFFLGSVYIQSRSMGDICKCRQLFCIVLNSLFPQILPWWLLVVASMVVMVYMEPLGGCRRWGSPEGVEHGGVVGVLPREPRGGSLLLWRRSRSIDGTKIIHLNKKKRRLIDGQSITFRFFEPKLVEFWKSFVKQADPLSSLYLIFEVCSNGFLLPV